MRKLGSELGVEAMSLYIYVPSEDAILDGIVDLLFSEVELPLTSGRDWDDIARDLFSAFRRVLLSHPKSVTLLASRTVRSFQALAPIELSLGNLRRAGFDRRTTIDTHRGLLSFTVGYVLSEVGGLDTPSDTWGTASSDGRSPRRLHQTARPRHHLRPVEPFDVDHGQVVGLGGEIDGRLPLLRAHVPEGGSAGGK